MLPGSPPGWPPSSRPYCGPGTASLRPPRLAAAIGSGGARPTAPPAAKVGNGARRGRGCDPPASVGNGAEGGGSAGAQQKVFREGVGRGDGTFAVQRIRSLLCLGCATVASGTLGGQREGAALARAGKVCGDHAMKGATARGVSGSPAIIPLAWSTVMTWLVLFVSHRAIAGPAPLCWGLCSCRSKKGKNNTGSAPAAVLLKPRRLYLILQGSGCLLSLWSKARWKLVAPVYRSFPA